MKLKNESGQITVFLSIVLLAVIILAGLLVDMSRYRCGETIVKKTVGSAAKSVLAQYSSKLKENYGIFAYNTDSEEELISKVEAYLEENLCTKNQSQGINLYDFRVEKVSVTPIFNLGENEVFKSQILEYMKYRAPKEIVEGFIERLSSVRDMGKMSVAYKKKVGIDKALGNMDKVQQVLKKSIDGAGESTGVCYYVNGFNLQGSWLAAFNSFIQSCNELEQLKKDLDAINSDISTLENDYKKEEKNGQTESFKENKTDDVKSVLTEMIEKRNALQKSIISINDNISSTFYDIRNSMTSGFIEPNNSAIKQLEKINEIGKNAETSINELEAYLKDNFNNENSYTQDFTSTLYDDLKDLKEMILAGKRAGTMVEQLDSNTEVLEGLTEKLDLIYGQINGSTYGSDDITGLKNGILELVGGYEDIEYSYDKPVKEKGLEDPRADQMKKLKDVFLNKILKDKNYLDAGIVPEQLPSNKKVTSKSFRVEDAPYVFSGDSTISDNYNTEDKKSYEYEGSLDNVAGEADLYDDEGCFQENALSFAGSIGELLSGEIDKLRDNIYINEYIMGMFKNQVPKLQTDTEDENCFLNGVAWKDKETFFDSEVEYVLHGNASEIANRTLTDAQIILLRFGADTLHVYMDPKKKEFSIVTATAIAGWWTGGAGIPILSNLIMCAWGMGEALIDLGILKEGGTVPLYKSQGDWKLDIGLPKGSGPKTDTRLCFNYYDYLRLFLLTLDENVKLGRVEDLIEINTGLAKPGFKASGYNTYIRIEAEVSMNCLFIDKAFMPSDIRTKDGRRLVRVLTYEGY